MADVIQHKHHDEAVWLKAWRNRNLVYKVARYVKKRHPWLDVDDVLTVGIEGLCRGYEGFVPGRGKETAYLCRSIQGAILKEIQQIREPIHVPGYARKQGVPVDVTGERTLDELPADNDTNPNTNTNTNTNTGTDDEPSIRRARIVHQALGCLSPRERKAVELMFGLGEQGYPLSLPEATEAMGGAERNVCERRRHGLAKIKAYLEQHHSREFA
jgi:RNA polymerase sigma factor (sigma-70 family)